PRTRNGYTSSLGQQLHGFFLVELHCAFELRRPDGRVDLRRIDARVAEQRADLLEVVVLFQDFHGHAVTQVVGLELRVADDAAIDFTEAPDVILRHWCSQFATHLADPDERAYQR